MSDSRQDHGSGGQWQGGAHWQSGGPAAGWYPDPWDAHRRRYWDGHAWTGDVSFEPPGSWGERSGGTQVSQVAPSAPSVQSAPQWQGAQTSPYGGGGYGGPPQHPAGWYGQQGWPAGAPARPVSTGGRIHVGVVALIAAIAIFAGIGIGSQVNASSSAPVAGPSAGGGGGAGAINPFGGGAGAGVSGGVTGSGSSTLTPAQQAIARTIDRSVVDINTELGYQDGAAAGTGMVLTPNGTILTNNHVIDGATSISVTVVSTGKTYKADVVGDDKTQDVAVIQMENASGLTPISLDQSSHVTRGASVVAIGNAGGAGGTPSAVSGTVTDLDQSITASDENGANSEMLVGLIQTNAPIQPGDSGGPLVDTKGQVIGMDTAASSSNTGQASEGFAIPIGTARGIAATIEKGQATAKIHIGQTGFLGVEVQAAQGTGLPGSIGSGNGASVETVLPGSPALQAGLVAGDVITAVDNTPITSANDLTTALSGDHPGDQIHLTWMAPSGQSHTAAVTLAVGPAQ
jgi:S1-C subfamily serine protease